MRLVIDAGEIVDRFEEPVRDADGVPVGDRRIHPMHRDDLERALLDRVAKQIIAHVLVHKMLGADCLPAYDFRTGEFMADTLRSSYVPQDERYYCWPVVGFTTQREAGTLTEYVRGVLRSCWA